MIRLEPYDDFLIAELHGGEWYMIHVCGTERRSRYLFENGIPEMGRPDDLKAKDAEGRKIVKRTWAIVKEEVLS